MSLSLKRGLPPEIDRGIQNLSKTLDSRFHGNDKKETITTFMDGH